MPNDNPSPTVVGDNADKGVGNDINSGLGDNVTVLGREDWLFRPIRNIIVSATAEDKIFHVGDTVTFDVIVYDSRSMITKKPNDIVAEGIRNYLAQKPVRFRHIDPNKDAYSLLGDVGTTPPVINNLMDGNGKPYMEVISPLVLKARSEEHVNLIELIVEKAEQYMKSGDPKDLMGVSIGWIESQSEFVPHEVSITPYPRCEQCVIVPGSQQLVKATAEGKNSCNNGCQSNTGEKSLTDEKMDKLKEDLFEQRMLVKEKDTEIASLKAELSDGKLASAKTLETNIAEVQTKHDTILAERKSEIDTLTTEVASLRAEIHTAVTMPLRKEIAEDILGYEKEEATAKIESLGKMSFEGLTQVRDDLKKSAKLASVKAEKKFNDEPLPFLAASDEVTPNIAEGMDMSLSDEKFAERFLGKEMFEAIGRGR